jgi:nucleoside-diphosphate-sugar epimerase
MSIHLITGATGFVGSALLARLLGDGEQVRILVRAAADAERWREHIERGALEVRVASLGDPNAIAAAADGVEVLYHCAAENSLDAAPAALAWVNVAGTENVRNAARRAGVRRFVQLSCTDVTLSNRDRMSWNESRQLDGLPIDAFCRSKLLAEELVLPSSSADFQACALRPAWVWGPGDRRALPALCREAARGRVSLCGPGNNLVPTVYIDNLVEALILAGEADDVGGRAFHVLDGEALTAREFMGELCQAVGLAAPVRGVYALAYSAAWLRERLGLPGLSRAEVARRGRSALFDAVAAVRELGYQPKVSVEEGMRALASWAKQAGGPAAIAQTIRTPTSQRDLEAMIRISEADATSPAA